MAPTGAAWVLGRSAASLEDDDLRLVGKRADGDLRLRLTDRLGGHLVEELVGSAEILRAAVDAVVHGNDDLRPDLRDDLGCLRRRQRRLASDRDEEHVDRPELADLLLG